MKTKFEYTVNGVYKVETHQTESAATYNDVVRRLLVNADKGSIRATTV